MHPDPIEELDMTDLAELIEDDDGEHEPSASDSE